MQAVGDGVAAVGEVEGEARKEDASGQGKKMGPCVTPIKCGELGGSGRRACVKVTVMGLLPCWLGRSAGRLLANTRGYAAAIGWVHRPLEGRGSRNIRLAEGRRPSLNRGGEMEVTDD